MERKVVIALLPERNVFAQKARYQPIGEYLSAKSGMDVSFRLLDSYGAVFNEIRGRTVDGAFFGSLNLVVAHLQEGVTVLARPLWKDGTSNYTGLIFARKDSLLSTDPRTWKGKRFSYVSRATTAGYLFPVAHLRRHGIADPDTFFSHSSFAGGHDAAALAVYEGNADLGACKNDVFLHLARANPAFRDAMQILAESEPVPSNGLGVRPDLDREIATELKTILLSMHKDPTGAKVLDAFGARMFIPTEIGEYQAVVSMAEEVGLDIRRYAASESAPALSSPPHGRTEVGRRP